MIANDIVHVKQAVRDFITGSICIEDLGDDDDLFESGVVNSLFAVELTIFVEKNFRIEIDTGDLDIENFKSVNATAAFILRKTGGTAA